MSKHYETKTPPMDDYKSIRVALMYALDLLDQMEKKHCDGLTEDPRSVESWLKNDGI